MNPMRLVIFGVALLTQYCRADIWPESTLKVAVSADGATLVRVVPSGSNDRGAHATATVFKFDAQSGDYKKVRTFALRNPDAPHEVVVSNDARFIVTFDDWGEVGRTENVVVVYKGTGEFVRAWALRDIFTEEEAEKFPSSVSSTWWRGVPYVLEDQAPFATIVIPPDTRHAFFDQEQKPRRAVIFDLSKMLFKHQ